jgi:D-alanyl-D-alanine endopeptidase (penicillin-binding protein 7)
MNAILTAVVPALGWSLIHFVWQGALIGMVTVLVLLVLHDAKPQLRYLIACCALALCAALPLVGVFAHLSGTPDGLLQRTEVLAAAATQGSATELGSWLQSRLNWIVGLWTLIASLFAARIAFGLAWIQRASRHARFYSEQSAWQQRLDRMATQFSITRAIVLRVVEDLETPVAAGCWRPVVLVPAAMLTGLPTDLLEALLAHELAHIKRLDYLVNLLQSLVEVALFYHPAVWWISRQIRIEREHVADDLAAAMLGEPRRLALALHGLAEFQSPSHSFAISANGGNLMNRIKRLIRPEVHVLSWKVMATLIGLVLAGMAMCIQAATSGAGAGAGPAVAGTVAGQIIEAGCKKPMYPAESLRKEETGAVTMQFLVDVGGHVIDSKVTRSSGYEALDRTAVAGLALCRFAPQTVDGKATQSWVKMQYVWKLE